MFGEMGKRKRQGNRESVVFFFTDVWLEFKSIFGRNDRGKYRQQRLPHIFKNNNNRLFYKIEY